MMVLSGLKAGEAGKIMLVLCGLKRMKKLRRMGLFAGESVEVTSANAAGELWVKTRSSQIALSQESAKRVYIKRT